MSWGRPYVLKVLQATFYPIKTAPLQRVLSYCAYSLTKSTLVVVGALQKQSPKLLNLILHKKTISDASMNRKIWVFLPVSFSLLVCRLAFFLSSFVFPFSACFFLRLFFALCHPFHPLPPCRPPSPIELLQAWSRKSRSLSTPPSPWNYSFVGVRPILLTFLVKKKPQVF